MLVPDMLFHHFVIFANMAVSLPLREHIRLGSNGLPGKDTLAYFVTSLVEEKMLYKIDTWTQCYKTFHVRNY